MMHSQQQRLALSSFAAFAYHCCLIQLLILCASVKGDCSSDSMHCADLGKIYYPFWGSAECAASPSYVLSNCTPSSSTLEVYWNSFSSTVNGAIGPPLVTAVTIDAIDLIDDYFIYYGPRPETIFQLSWNKSLIELDSCVPASFSSENLSLYNIPSSINLTRFSDSSALEFSPNNTFLLFNCSHYSKTSSVVKQLGSQSFLTESHSAACKAYKVSCPSLASTPCIQWSVPQSMKELMLQHVLDSLACSHFMFGAGSALDSLRPIGSIELIWRDIQCEKCESATGNCIYDKTIPAKFNHCESASGYMPGPQCYGDALHCNTGAKIGFAAAVVLVALGVLMLAIRFKGTIRERTGVAFVSFTKVTIPIAINVLKSTLRKLQSVSYSPNTFFKYIDFDGLTERPVEYSYGSIASATKSFTSLVGEGGFGTVFKGSFTQASSHGGSEIQIAVKVLEVTSKHSKKQFLNEVITIGRIHHVNVVRLLGFCMQEDHEMLVYEYVVNGSLDKWLFVERENDDNKLLDWGQRYAIALGVARGLSYLHEECRHRTVHCDIKPQNILLDESMHSKIADFGLARLMGRDESKVVTFAKGTPGYMAPEFWMGGESQLSPKFDVYSYGMVLLELISGRRNFRRDAGALNSSSSFPAMAFKAAMEGDLQSILDPRLSISTNIDGDEAQLARAQWGQIKTAAFVALWCIQDHPESRPCMSEVVKYLEGGAAVPECPPQPNISTFARPVAGTSPQEPSSFNYVDENDFTALSVGR